MLSCYKNKGRSIPFTLCKGHQGGRGGAVGRHMLATLKESVPPLGCRLSRDLPGKIFDVSKASLILIAMGLLAKIWGHFLFVMFKEN